MLILAFPQSSQASATVKYSGQRAGASCKKLDLNKFVTLPNKTQLKCTKTNGKFLWIQQPTPSKSAAPVSNTVTPLQQWGETNFGKFRILNSFSLASIGLEDHFGKGTAYRIEACLQSWQPANPIGFSFSFQAWKAVDTIGQVLPPSTIVGPSELAPAYLDVFSDLILQPGQCFSGHIVFNSQYEITQLRYRDPTFGYELQFSTN
jgi:hypothetical protein